MTPYTKKQLKDYKSLIHCILQMDKERGLDMSAAIASIKRELGHEWAVGAALLLYVLQMLASVHTLRMWNIVKQFNPRMHIPAFSNGELQYDHGREFIREKSANVRIRKRKNVSKSARSGTAVAE